MVETVEEEFGRLRVPKEGEIVGIITALVGGSRFIVMCSDKRERMCRVPGKIKHKVWVKEGDIVIVKPWEIEGEKKGDIIWRYTRIQATWLKRQGYLKDLPF